MEIFHCFVNGHLIRKLKTWKIDQDRCTEILKSDGLVFRDISVERTFLWISCGIIHFWEHAKGQKNQNYCLSAIFSKVLVQILHLVAFLRRFIDLYNGRIAFKIL
jgi:hypothetical protein